MLSLTLIVLFVFVQPIVSKQCLIIEDLVDEELWNYFAGFWCYYYTSDLVWRYEYIITAISFNNETYYVYALNVNGSALLLDFKDEASMAYIKNQFPSDAAYRFYLACNQDSVNCCQDEMDEDNIRYSESYCPVIWDSWTCFPQTKVNTTAKMPCSSQYYGADSDICTLESQKKCIWNNATQLAEWVQSTDYSTCSTVPLYKRRYNFHVISLSVCIVFCLPAIVIFLSFEKLRKTIRVVLHRNLLIAICIRCMLTIISKELIYLDALREESYHTMENNGVVCRALTFLESSAVNGIYGCMLLDAFYLHKVIVRAFAKEVKMKYIYTVLVALTFTFSTAWAASMASINAKLCWLSSNNLQWIMDGYRIAILFINTVLLGDIIRVMVLKIKHGTTTEQTMAAFRATIFLIPLFGLHIILTANKIVYDKSCTAEDVYEYVRYTMEGLQGIVVSIIFCYANKEVQGEIKNMYRKLCIYLNQRFDWHLGENYDKRRATTATFVQDNYN
ncbi:calcitonin gene-related peptide type 1 receptor isoform X1 [Diabrotica virgifera virgifera]|uniref:Calcitonin gene-related peptide type 1 receptor-like isoform X1 n=1 Tax=Diabrotica virgifera virgifera TaxID=50390 RepID=A0A6P7FDA6_DIAVI|nr:calcitonin gene-related peptide type 1 receptor isoform X1 [Diabrotica virgifera virgifera]